MQSFYVQSYKRPAWFEPSPPPFSNRWPGSLGLNPTLRMAWSGSANENCSTAISLFCFWLHLFSSLQTPAIFSPFLCTSPFSFFCFSFFFASFLISSSLSHLLSFPFLHGCSVLFPSSFLSFRFWWWSQRKPDLVKTASSSAVSGLPFPAHWNGSIGQRFGQSGLWALFGPSPLIWSWA